MDSDFAFLDGLDDLFGPEENDDPPKKRPGASQKGVVSHRGGKRQLTRKAASEAALEKALDWHFQPGDCYHVRGKTDD